MSRSPYDIVIVGGGIMGCASALRLADHGLRVALVERAALGQGASGVNAGTLSLQIKRVDLMQYALRGHRLWTRFGDRVGFVQSGGLTLAFTQQEAELLYTRMKLKREAGAPIAFVSKAELEKIEPGITGDVVAASWCGEDGYSNSSLTGDFYRKCLMESGVDVFEQQQVTRIEHDSGFEITAGQNRYRGRQLLLACGAWLKSAALMLDVDLPINARVNTVSVTERMPDLMTTVIGHATGLLTMKQKPNGTVLIGGGWQGVGSPDAGRGSVVAPNLLHNLRLAQHVLPALGGARILRSWTGYEANVPDFFPLAGKLPGYQDAYVLGCVRGGYTIGPYLGQLMGDYVAGVEPELPLFDPARNFQQN